MEVLGQKVNICKVLIRGLGIYVFFYIKKLRKTYFSSGQKLSVHA